MIDKSKSIFLKGNVPSSKNNKELGYYFLKPAQESSWYIKKGDQFKKIRPTLRNSDRTEAYIKHIVAQIIEYKPRFKELVKNLPKPYIIQLHFVRDSRHRFDFGNAGQIISDSISGHYWKNDKKIPHIATCWVEDDSMDDLIFVPPLKPPFYTYDKVSPGVWLTVLDLYKSDVVELPLEDSK